MTGGDAAKGESRARASRGRRAEEAVADYLVAHEFEVLERNLRLGRLEIDLVARRGPLVVVVEVRTRGPGSFVSALASITAKKRARLVLATERLWRQRLAGMPDVERVRIDVAGVSFDDGKTCVEYIEGAVVASPPV
jgi:putative endonuclease